MNHFVRIKGKSAETLASSRPAERPPDHPRFEQPPAPRSAKLRLEVDASTLLRLLGNGDLCAAGLRCLDRDSHSILRRLCLQACMNTSCRLRAMCEAAPDAECPSAEE